jgi:cytoskeletal protein RodZ
MARTVEVEVVDIQESVPKVQEKSQKPESEKKSPSKRLSRWIFVLAAAIAATVVAQMANGASLSEVSSHCRQGQADRRFSQK